MLTGVFAKSSRKTSDEWLSDDACRTGKSRFGVPALLSGLEKLKLGRGRLEMSELMEGDRCARPRPGERTPLLLENFRGACEWIDVLRELKPSPSVDSCEDIMLEDRFENEGRGGRSPATSKVCIFESFSGELAMEYVDTGDCWGMLSWVTDRVRFTFSDGALVTFRSMGVGDCSLLAPMPKKLPCSSTSVNPFLIASKFRRVGIGSCWSSGGGTPLILG